MAQRMRHICASSMIATSERVGVGAHREDFILDAPVRAFIEGAEFRDPGWRNQRGVASLTRLTTARYAGRKKGNVRWDTDKSRLTSHR